MGGGVGLAGGAGVLSVAGAGMGVDTGAGVAAGACGGGGGFTGVLDAFPELLAVATAFRTAATNGSPPPRGISVAPVKIVLKGTNFPYNSRVASSSCEMVEPLMVTPANRPRAREYVSTSALSFQSVEPSTWRPTGPAAADASAPTLNLLVSSACMPRSFMIIMTRSTPCRPI